MGGWEAQPLPFLCNSNPSLRLCAGGEASAPSPFLAAWELPQVLAGIQAEQTAPHSQLPWQSTSFLIKLHLAFFPPIHNQCSTVNTQVRSERGYTGAPAPLHLGSMWTFPLHVFSNRLPSLLKCCGFTIHTRGSWLLNSGSCWWMLVASEEGRFPNPPCTAPEAWHCNVNVLS